MTATATAPAPAAVRDPRAFVPPEVWDREIALLIRDHPWDTVMAERCFDQAIAYLITAMEKHGQHLGLGCGPLIDIAVHGFILDTTNYREFCAGTSTAVSWSTRPRSSSSTTGRS